MITGYDRQLKDELTIGDLSFRIRWHSVEIAWPSVFRNFIFHCLLAIARPKVAMEICLVPRVSHMPALRMQIYFRKWVVCPIKTDPRIMFAGQVTRKAFWALHTATTCNTLDNGSKRLTHRHHMRKTQAQQNNKTKKQLQEQKAPIGSPFPLLDAWPFGSPLGFPLAPFDLPLASPAPISVSSEESPISVNHFDLLKTPIVCMIW